MAQVTTNPYLLSNQAAAINKPEIQAEVYSSRVSRYDTLTSLVMRWGNFESVQTPNTKWTWGISPPATIAYTTSSNSTLLGNGNLEVNLNIPTGGTNFYRLTEVVKDNNNNQGVVVAKTTNTIELAPQGGIAFIPATNFTNGTTVKIIGNAQKMAGSGNMETLVYDLDTEYGYTQIRREGISFSRKDLAQKTWFTNRDGKMWYDFDLQQVEVRYKKRDEHTLYWGKRTLTGTENSRDAVYKSEGIRESIRTRNSDLYLALSNEMTEGDLQDFIRQYKTKTKKNKVLVFAGAQWIANFQNITRAYVLEAGDRNTFGGSNVKGLSCFYYNYMGLEMLIHEWDLFNDPEDDNNLSSVTGLPKNQSSALFFNPDKIASSSGQSMLPPIVCKHIGSQRRLAGFIRGMVEPESLSVSDLSAGNLMYLGNNFVSAVDEVTYATMGDYGYQIEPQNFGLMELTS